MLLFLVNWGYPIVWGYNSWENKSRNPFPSVVQLLTSPDFLVIDLDSTTNNYWDRRRERERERELGKSMLSMQHDDDIDWLYSSDSKSKIVLKTDQNTKFKYIFSFEPETLMKTTLLYSKIVWIIFSSLNKVLLYKLVSRDNPIYCNAVGAFTTSEWQQVVNQRNSLCGCKSWEIFKSFRQRIRNDLNFRTSKTAAPFHWWWAMI